MLTLMSTRHQLIKKFLVSIPDVYAQHHGLGIVLDAFFQIKTGLDLSAREPDILFVAKGNFGRLKKNYLNGQANLVIEIFPPQSRLHNQGEKFTKYELGAVRKHWLSDLDEQQADFYQLGADAHYQVVDPEPDKIHSLQTVPGFWLKADWPFQGSLSSNFKVLKE